MTLFFVPQHVKNFSFLAVCTVFDYTLLCSFSLHTLHRKTPSGYWSNKTLIDKCVSPVSHEIEARVKIEGTSTRLIALMNPPPPSATKESRPLAQPCAREAKSYDSAAPTSSMLSQRGAWCTLACQQQATASRNLLPTHIATTIYLTLHRTYV
jgi:hypothetical protein